MENLPRDFKGIWIPREIWLDDRLTYFERCLLAEINSLDGRDGCFASNEYLANFFNERERKIQEGISKLKELGYVYQESFDGRQRVLRTNLYKQNLAPLPCGIPHPCDADFRTPDTGTHTIYREKTEKKEQQRGAVAVSLSKEDQAKANELKKLPLQPGVIDSSMRHSLQDIKNAVEHCLSRLDSIRDIDAYFHEALVKKWSPKFTKEKIVKLNEEKEQQQQQELQRVYTEAKQLELAHKYNLKDTASFSVTENAITLKINGGYSPMPLDNESLITLKKYIEANKTHRN